MKLRIADNSVRLRLGQSEVAQLASRGSVEAVLRFGNQLALTYRLTSDAQIATPAAIFNNGVLEVLIPTEAARQWSANNEVAISGIQETGAAEPLAILIEKDFQCLHKEDGAQEDNYPNPALQVN